MTRSPKQPVAPDTLSNLGLLLVELPRHTEAEAMLLQAAEHQRGIGSAFGLAVSSENLCEAAGPSKPTHCCA